MPFIKFKLKDFINEEMGPEYETIINSDYIVNINKGEFLTLFWKKNIENNNVTMSFIQEPSNDDLLYFLKIREREYAFILDKWIYNKSGSASLSFKDKNSNQRHRIEVSKFIFNEIKERLSVKVFESTSDIEYFLGRY